MYDVILSFITAFTLTYFAIPSIIHVAKIKNLCDEPGERRSHKESTPSLGGIGIFAGVIFSIILWTPFGYFSDLQYILCAFIIIFLIGAKDDILPMSPNKKLVGEVLAAAILVFKSNVKLTSLYGILGIYELPEIVSILLSIFTILVIINAFNLIDGINGLSGSIGILIAATLGSWFFLAKQPELAIVAFSLTGALVAFLKYNFTPAKIFMGDTGALLIGLVCSILAIKFIELQHELRGIAASEQLAEGLFFEAVPAVAIGIMILPLFDTLRVFTMRLLNGKSPFYPDRTHIHHLLIDYGFSHMQATGILVLVNIFFIILAIGLQHIGSMSLLLVILALATSMTATLYRSVAKKKPLQSE
ncbi:MAG: MraY family glycosyltransferase [Bacteroidota bacterium]